MIALLWQRVWFEPKARARLIALPVLAASAVLLGVAASLPPDERGHGTHEQLGLPACSVQVFSDKPCPTCGMTTAFSHLVRGQVAAAFTTQPAGAVLGLIALVAAVLSGHALLTGRSHGWVRRLWRLEVLIGLAMIVLLAWAYKLAQAGAIG